MKKLIVAFAVGMVCVGAMAQGKVTLANNTQRLVYWESSMAGVTAADNLKVDLWAGADSSSLVWVGTSTGWNAATPGLFNSLNVILPTGFPGGTTDTFKYFFQVQVYDTAFANAAAAASAGGAYGYSDLFQVRASSTPAYNAIWNTGSPAFSTWGPGTAALTGGGFGAIGVIVPEPSSFALAGLGAAALLIFRRRN